MTGRAGNIPHPAQRHQPGVTMTPQQSQALRELCERYHVPFSADDFRQPFDLPAGYVAGWVGPIYVGCDPTGRISS